MPQAHLAHKFLHDGAIVSRVTRRERGDRESAGAECVVGRPGQRGGIRAHGERDDERRKFGEPREQEIFSFFGGRCIALCMTNMNELFHLSAEYISECGWHRRLRRIRSHLKSRRTSPLPFPQSVLTQCPTHSQCPSP